MGDMNFKKSRKEEENHGFYIYELQHVKIHFKNTSFDSIFQRSVWLRNEQQLPQCLKHQSSRAFSHFLTYLSSNKAKSRITKAKTTLAKNSEARLSFCSANVLDSRGKAA